MRKKAVEVTSVKRVEFISDGMSYTTLADHWCDIIVLNVHARTEDKNDDTKDSFTRNQSVYWISSRSTT